MPELGTSGTVGGEGGNVLVYPAEFRWGLIGIHNCRDAGDG
jgi:hypothetical protein